MVRTAPVMVTTAVPLPPGTVGGLMVQVVVPSDDGTLQVRATSELNPPAGATVRLSVMAVPLGMETTGLATVRVKSGDSDGDRNLKRLSQRGAGDRVMVMEPVAAEGSRDCQSAESTETCCGWHVTALGASEQVSPRYRCRTETDRTSEKCTCSQRDRLGGGSARRYVSDTDCRRRSGSRDS